jgi:hypothetical protein
MGFFNPQMVDQSLMCLEMMDFDDKDLIMQKISQMGTMHQKLIQYMQLALNLAAATNPMLAEQIAQDVIATNGGAGIAPMGATQSHITQSNNISGIPQEEHAIVKNARQQSNEASQPHSDGVVNTKR